MALKSMTGYGQAETLTQSGTFRVEIKSVNNRFLEIQTRLPRSLSSLDTHIKKTISSLISRGSLLVIMTWDKEEADTRLVYDKKAVEDYVSILRSIKSDYNLHGEVTISDLIQFNDVIRTETISINNTTTWRALKPVLLDAINDFQKSREKEGSFIAKDLTAMAKKISTLIRRVQKRSPIRLKKYSADLKIKIEKLADSVADPQRINTEIAILGDRLDLSEECTRVQSHIKNFTDCFQSSEPVGKRIGFILQELNREANTIGSKANDFYIADYSVQLKELIEKIREQIQNIE